VGCQLLEQILTLLIHGNPLVDMSVFRVLRVLQLVRITRLIRVFRLIEDLHTIIASIASSMKFFSWTVLLLFTVVYMFSIFFCQAYLNVDIETAPHAEDLKHWYGCLGRTALTLFESIAGGVSWDEAVVPLMRDISPLMGVVFSFYIMGVVFALMNVIAGVFVDQAIRTAQQDKDHYMTSHMGDLFFNSGCNVVTWEEFKTKINAPDMQDYFRSINLNPAEARGLFDLLDVDGNGEVDVHEFVEGCLRLRGGAKALELSLAMQEISRFYTRFVNHQVTVERDLAHICRIVDPEDCEYASI